MKKVVVIGGGFAGTRIAKKLEKNFSVVLIDSKDYFEYTPGILRTIVEPAHVKKIQARHKDYLKKTKIVIDNVIEINKKYVLVKGGEKVYYDYLAICSGSNYNLPIKEQEILIGSRVEHLKKAYERLMEAKRVLIIGGGLVGVELAAEICTHWKNRKVILMHSHDRLIPRNNDKTIRYVEKFLKSRGVELILKERMKDVKNNICITENGKKIKADIVFLTLGIAPNSEFMRKNFSEVLDSKSQIIVDDYLQVKGQKNIFAVGDVNSVSEEKTAQNAERQAKIVVKNLRVLEFGGKMEEYESKKTALVISLGKYNGVFEWGNLVIGGKIPALMKWMIERWIMFGYI